MTVAMIVTLPMWVALQAFVATLVGGAVPVGMVLQMVSVDAALLLAQGLVQVPAPL